MEAADRDGFARGGLFRDEQARVAIAAGRYDARREQDGALAEQTRHLTRRERALERRARGDAELPRECA